MIYTEFTLYILFTIEYNYSIYNFITYNYIKYILVLLIFTVHEIFTYILYINML